MKDYQNDYPDFRASPHHEHGDERPSNTSANPTFYDVIETRVARRGFLMGGMAAIATGIFGSSLTGRAALAQTASPSGLLGFTPVPVSLEDKVIVPAGYKVQVLAPWGTPVTGDMPAYVPGGATGAAQGAQVGSHHDGMSFFAIEGSNDDGLLVFNHEYVEPRYMHAVKWAGQALDGETVVYTADGKRDDDEVLAEINAHGCTVARITKGADGTWAIVADPMNRRITGLTEMAISGPAAGSAHLVTKFSPDGTKTRGTLNNCANGHTPWNTYMTAEENWAGYFVSPGEQPREHARYGVSDEATRYGWDKAASAADEYIRFNATATGASAAEDYRNEPNTFGWMVEFDPFDPASVPVKRTALGRFAHEGVVFAPAVAGQPIVCYSGDDSRFEYIYKFVSAAALRPRHRLGRAARRRHALCGEVQRGRHRRMARPCTRPEWPDARERLRRSRRHHRQHPPRRRSGGRHQDGPPRMGHRRSENGRGLFHPDQQQPPHPASGRCRQPARRKQLRSDRPLAVRRRATQPATAFAWDLFVIAGTAKQSATFNDEALGEDNIFACPDGIWCDANSRLWIQTDMGDIGPAQEGPLKDFGLNQMLAADPATGEIRRFLTGPWGQEITGIAATPDGTTMFVNVQHPGGHASAEDFAAGNFGSGFPDYDGSVPRSATLVISREDGGVVGT